MTLSNASNATISDATGTFTITDDDTPSLSINDVSTSDESNAATNMTVTLSEASTKTVTVDFATSNGTATAGSDYTATNNTLTFSAGETSKTIPVTVLSDTLDEANETVTMTLSSATNATISDATGTFTITDDDNTPSLSINDVSTSDESNTATNMTVTLSAAAGRDVTVDYATSNGTATAGTDYTATSGTLTISAGSTTGTIGVTVLTDAIYEGDETVTMTLSSASNATISDSTGTFTVTDDESAPTVQLAANASSIDENSGSTITITASFNGSTATDSAITVALGTSGTATEGEDYSDDGGTSALDDITISAGATSGSVTFDPTADTVCEIGNQAATISITGVSGKTGVAENSTPQAVTITITEPDEFVCGTQLSYSPSNASTKLGEAEFNYTNDALTGLSGLSSQSNFEVINLHKAKGGYGLTGDNQLVAIMDNGFNTSHNEFNGAGRTISNYNTLSTATASSFHGAAVMGILAADNDGAGPEGVADMADVRLYEMTSIFTSAGWAALDAMVNDARSQGAVVINQSFGYNTINADDLQFLIDNFSSNTTTELFQYIISDYLVEAADNNSPDTTWFDLDGTLDSTWQTRIDEYITALNNYQDTGVVVQSNSNTNTNIGAAYTEIDADLMAALPEFYSQLEEAWITAINIEVDGASGSESYTLMSAPCGVTAEYCLGADGTQMAGVAINTSDYYNIGSGTSYAAPQISGAIALLAEAFPNHTPEMLVDRLLATGQNSTSLIGSHTGAVTFGNGVQHGYNSNYGHGLMDVYAALNPITSSSYSQSIFPNGGNLGDPINNGQNGNGGQSFALTTLSVSQSFGDSISTALSEEVNYFYDALNGGFAYKMDGHVIPQSNTKPVINLEAEMSGMKSASTLNNYLNIGKTDYKNILYKKSFSDDEDLEKQLALTLGYSALPVQSFFNFEQMALNGITSYNLPFLDQQDQGLSLNTLIEGERFKFSLSSTTPVKQRDGEGDDVYMGNSTSLMSTMEYTFNEDVVLGLLSGFVEEREGFLGLEGNEAFSLDNSSNLSKFNSLKIQKNIKEDLALTLTGTLAYSDFEGDSTSLLKSADNVLSESYSLTLNKANLFGNDNFSISISQPNRVRDGSLTLRLSDLADQDGNINIRDTEVDLEPSGRQIDTSFAYTKDISEDFTLSLKATITDEYNHIKDNDKHYSGYIGLNFENLKVGISDATNISRPSVQLKYRKEF